MLSKNYPSMFKKIFLVSEAIILALPMPCQMGMYITLFDRYSINQMKKKVKILGIKLSLLSIF